MCNGVKCNEVVNKYILIVVDMQEGFVKQESMRKLSEEVLRLLDRELFDVVIATRFLNEDNSMYEKLFGWTKLKCKEEQQLIEGLERYADFVSDKKIYTCVTEEFVEELCRRNGGECPERVFVIGVDTDSCVLATATGLFEVNIRPVVLTRYCGSNGGKGFHDAGLLCLKRLIGEAQLVDKEILTREDLDS